MMKRTITLLVLCVFYYNSSVCKSAEPPENNDLVDSNSVSEPNEPLSNAYLLEDFNDVFFLNWGVLGYDPS